MHKKTMKQRKALKRRLELIFLKRSLHKLELLLPMLCPCCETAGTLEEMRLLEQRLHRLLRQA